MKNSKDHMERYFKRISFTILILMGCLFSADAQQEIVFKSRSLTLSQFLSDVLKGNLEYIANQLNVSISEAELKAAKVFPDPEFEVIYSNNEDRVMQMGQSVEAGISYPVNLGNKRKAGIGLARSNHELSQILLDAFFKDLRADASLSYFATLREYKIYLLQQDILQQLSGLARADSIRMETGEATGLDALQSSLEARSQLTKVYQSIADMQNSSLNLIRLKGTRFTDTLLSPSDEFPDVKYSFNLNDLISDAVENRVELLAAIKNKEVSDNTLRLLKADRAFEFNIEAGYSYNSLVKNEIAPAPSYNGLSAGIAIPLKLSNLNKGALLAADLAVKQAHLLYEETEIQIVSEVVQAYNNFIAQNKKVEHYKQGLVEDAYKILTGRIYSYQHGESDLLAVLNAQRTYTELQLEHLDAQYEYTAALIELERAAGIWENDL